MSEYFADYEAEDETDDRKLVSCCRCQILSVIYLFKFQKFIKFQNNEHAPPLLLLD